MEQHLATIPPEWKTELEHLHERMKRIMKSAFVEFGSDLGYIQKRKLYLVYDVSFEKYLENYWDMELSRAYQLISAAEAYKGLEAKLSTNSKLVEESSTKVELPTRETHIRPLLKLENENYRAEVWKRVIESGEIITAKLVIAEVERKLAELKKEYYTVDEWAKLSEAEKTRLLTTRSDKTFNETNDNIEWAAWSWNPVTGCKYDCDYCYAEEIANRFYPQKFEPSFYPVRLSMPQNTRFTGPRYEDDKGYKKVFVCSMADLFGSWVPNEWITPVLKQVANNPQWTFIFLTKNPRRLTSFTFPDNAWIGATVDRQARVTPTETAMQDVRARVKFVSCEPMLEPIHFNGIDIFDWIIIGGRSKTSKLPEFQPEWGWVYGLTRDATEAGCKVYWKPNLTIRPRQYPE